MSDEAWCAVGRHAPSLLALLAYQDSPHISANEMLRHKLKTVLLTALLTGAFPLSSHPPCTHLHRAGTRLVSQKASRVRLARLSRMARQLPVAAKRLGDVFGAWLQAVSRIRIVHSG
jgi:hypothetical protein